MKRMLINATHKDQELRIAIADGQRLDNLIIDSSSHEQKQGNIYVAVVTRIEVSLEAAFVNFGGNRHGFLPLKEVARSCFKKSYIELTRRPSIDEVLEEGQQLIIQVEKEERGSKGAAVTTYISLPGRYLVLMPNSPGAGGVSRRIDGVERNEIHENMGQLTVPEDMGLIIRTAGAGRSVEELQWDLEILLKVWNAILEATQHKEAPCLIYQEGDAIIRAMRDHLLPTIDEILVDQESMFEHIVQHLKVVRPDFVNRVKLYKEPTPLFNRFQIEIQIERIYQREVELPSGGALIIDRTEALVSIDINSARSTKGSDIEETAFLTNLEAAEEIPRQLRLRDLGGLIVIDFIDMLSIENQREVEKRLKKYLKSDRARVQVGRISRFGLLEMSRQRLRTSIGESSQITCPRCDGHGTIRGVESLSLSVMRLIEEEAIKDNTAQVRALVPVEIATYLLNEKRKAIIDIELRQHVSILIIPSTQLLTPQYQVERVRLSDWNDREEKKVSYKINLKEKETVTGRPFPAPAKPVGTPQESIIKTSHIQEKLTTTAPMATTSSSTADKNDSGLLRKMIRFLFSKKPAISSPSAEAPPSSVKTAPPPYRNSERPSRPAHFKRRDDRKEGRPAAAHPTASSGQPPQRRHNNNNKKRTPNRYNEEQQRSRGNRSNNSASPASPSTFTPISPTLSEESSVDRPIRNTVKSLPAAATVPAMDSPKTMQQQSPLPPVMSTSPVVSEGQSQNSMEQQPIKRIKKPLIKTVRIKSTDKTKPLQGEDIYRKEEDE